MSNEDRLDDHQAMIAVLNERFSTLAKQLHDLEARVSSTGTAQPSPTASRSTTNLHLEYGIKYENGGVAICSSMEDAQKNLRFVKDDKVVRRWVGEWEDAD